jgi:hypothetical protein
MDLVQCPHCQTRVLPTTSGECPACGRGLPDPAPEVLVPPGDSRSDSTVDALRQDEDEDEDDDDDDWEGTTSLTESLRKLKRPIACVLLAPTVLGLLFLAIGVLAWIAEWVMDALETIKR